MFFFNFVTLLEVMKLNTHIVDMQCLDWPPTRSEHLLSVSYVLGLFMVMYKLQWSGNYLEAIMSTRKALQQRECHGCWCSSLPVSSPWTVSKR